MRIVGTTAGRTVFDVPLPHGRAPEAVTYEAGFVVEKALSADRDPDGELVLRLQVRPATTEQRPTELGRGRDAGLTLGPDEIPRRRQRVAAYAVVRSARGLLATQYSARTAVDGRWGMPGGGIDVGEDPADAVRREAYEETAQTVVLGELHTIQTSHWVGRSPSGPVEDFHAVRLVYLAECPEPTEPVVIDHNGTTAAARWVPLPTWSTLGWTVGWRQILGDLLG